MTAPPSSTSSGSSRTMSASSSSAAACSKPIQRWGSSEHTDVDAKANPKTLKMKKPSFRASFHGLAHSSAEGSASSKNTTTTSKKKGFGSLVKKFPKKLLSYQQYPNAKIVKDSIPILDEEIQIMTQDAPFMDSQQADPSICLLDRKEVVLGELLGEGQFAQVYAVKGWNLREQHELNVEEDAKRASFVHDFHNCSHNAHKAQFCHSYAIKHLKKDLLVKTSRRLIQRKRKTQVEVAAGDSELPMDQQFQLAAADLVVEALYLSRLQHPHILRARGMALGGTAAFGNGRYDSYFLILDRLSETLDQRITHWSKQHPSPQESQLCLKTEYAYQMAQALDYLHQRRIIFRDLKPSNIGFQQDDDTLQIFDFGLCRELPASQRSGAADPDDEVYFMTAAGTHRYMAVEVHKGEQYNQKADVYSFAMVYYELLAQEAPFLNFSEDDHATLVCERQVRPQHFFGCVVPLAIQNLLKDAWAHSIQNRLTMAQVVTRLEEILIHTFGQQLPNNCASKKNGEKCCEKQPAEDQVQPQTTNPTNNPATMVSAIS